MSVAREDRNGEKRRSEVTERESERSDGKIGMEKVVREAKER